MENSMEIFSKSNRKKNACFQLKRTDSTNSRLLKVVGLVKNRSNSNIIP